MPKLGNAYGYGKKQIHQRLLHDDSCFFDPLLLRFDALALAELFVR